MIRVFCDCCGKEKPTKVISIPCHMWSLFSPGGGYVDNEDNQVSGRMDTIDACNRCYNVIYGDVRKAVLGIQALNAKTLAKNVGFWSK